MMFENSPFAGLYASLPDVDSYLQRIGYDGAAEPTLLCLQNLMTCHLRTVPFENLDVYFEHKVPSLNTEDLFAKIVLQKRGGYCFELNGLFWHLLRALGFQAWCTAARIVLGRDYPMPLVHRVILVEIEGQKYFCDVGYGGPAPRKPIPVLYEENEITDGTHCYMFQKNGNEITLFIEKEGAFVPLMSYGDTFCDPVDFLPYNTFCAVSPEEPFCNKVMVHIATADGKKSIDGSTFRVLECGKSTEREILPEQLEEILLCEFGIPYKKVRC